MALVAQAAKRDLAYRTPRPRILPCGKRGSM